MQKYLRSNNLDEPRIALRLNSMTTMFRIATQNNLLILAADSLQEEAELRGLMMLEHEGTIWEFPVGMAYRSNTAHLSVIKFLIACMKDI